jgi:predicted PurR-regulated permease PerM
MSRVVSFLVLLGVIAVLAFWFYRVISGFLLPLFLAALLVVIFRPWHRWFQVRCRKRVRLAAALTTASVIVVVLVPSAILGSLVTWELIEKTTRTVAKDAAASDEPEDTTSLGRGIAGRLASLRNSLDLEIPHARELRFIESSLASLQSHAAAGATYQGDPDALSRMRDVLTELKQLVSEGTRAAEGTVLVANMIETLDEALGDPKVQAGTLQYQEVLVDTELQYRQLKIVLIGSPVRAWLADFVNPTDAEQRGLADRIGAFAPGLLRSVGGATGAFLANVVFGIVVMVIALYFFLADGPAMLQTLMRLSPLDDDHERILVTEFDRISRAVVLATLLSALGQAVLAGLGFWVISLFVSNFQVVFTLTLLTAVLALIPFVGAAAVWVPVSLWLFYQQQYTCAILLGVYGAGVISLADNVIKPMVLHGQSNLHPLLALLSVLGGVQALGPIGILVGPMVVVFLQTLLNILHRELTDGPEESTRQLRRESLPLILSLRQTGLRLPYATPNRNRRVI